MRCSNSSDQAGTRHSARTWPTRPHWVPRALSRPARSHPVGPGPAVTILTGHSRGSWREEKADQLIAAARETLDLWADGLDFPELADDIAIEARLALQLTDEIKELETRIAALLDKADPGGIVCSAPGVGPILAG
jgi:hypothetical protein